MGYFASAADRAEYVAQVIKHSPDAFDFLVRNAKGELLARKPAEDTGCCSTCLMSDVDAQAFREGMCHCWYHHDMRIMTDNCERYLYSHDREEMQ